MLHEVSVNVWNAKRRLLERQETALSCLAQQQIYITSCRLMLQAHWWRGERSVNLASRCSQLPRPTLNHRQGGDRKELSCHRLLRKNPEPLGLLRLVVRQIRRCRFEPIHLCGRIATIPLCTSQHLRPCEMGWHRTPICLIDQLSLL